MTKLDKQPLSEGRLSSSHTALAGYLRPPLRILYFVASQKWTLLPTGSTIVGLRRACNSVALGSQNSSEFLGVLGAAGSALSGSEPFGVLGRPWLGVARPAKFFSSFESFSSSDSRWESAERL